ncbi:O-antigen ligase family protein [Vibrio breoganii]
MDDKTKKISTFLIVTSLIGVAIFSYNFFIPNNNDKLLYDSKRIFLLTLISLNALFIITMPNLRKKITEIRLSHQSNIACVLFLFSVLVANFFTDYPSRAWMDFLYSIGLLLLILVLSISARSKRLIIYSLFFVIGLLLFLSTLIGYWSDLLNFSSRPDYFSIIGIVNPRVVNQMQAWVFIPIFYFTLISFRNSKYKRTLLLLATQISLLISTDARGASLSILGGVILLFIVSNNRKDIVKVSAHAIILGIAIKLLLFSPVPGYLILGENLELFSFRTTTQDRIDIWLQTINNLTFIGGGGNSYPCLTGGTTPHNSVLLIAINWGILAAVAYVYLVIKLFISIFNKCNTLKERVIAISIMTALAYSLISGVLVYPLSQVLGILSFSLLLSYRATNKNNANTLFLRKIITNSLCIIIIITCTLFSYERINNDFYIEEGPMVLTPQFWLELRGDHCIDR